MCGFFLLNEYDLLLEKNEEWHSRAAQWPWEVWAFFNCDLIELFKLLFYGKKQTQTNQTKPGNQHKNLRNLQNRQEFYRIDKINIYGEVSHFKWLIKTKLQFNFVWSRVLRSKKECCNFFVLTDFQMLTFVWPKQFWKVHFWMTQSHIYILKIFIEYHLFQVDGSKGKYAVLIAVRVMACFQEGFHLQLVMKPIYLKYKRWFSCLPRGL